jgi:hypothetical protein
MLGLDSHSVIARIRSGSGKVVLPDLKQSITVGTIGFTVVSVLMFGVWAVAGSWLSRNLGELGFYAVLAIGFMAAGGGSFAPILIGKDLGRFYVLFIGSFLLYAVIWTACWFLLRELKWGREWAGSIVGPALMGLIFAWAFRANEQIWRCVLAMVVGNTAGYFVGEWLFYMPPLHNQYGMILWGITYGAGFGAGIAASLYWCQTETREKLKAASQAAAPATS